MAEERQSLSWEDDGYGSPSRVQVLNAETWQGLREEIRARRWRAIPAGYMGDDYAGRRYAQSCKLLHVGKVSSGVAAVVLVTDHYDI
jgi:hypothetical protein